MAKEKIDSLHGMFEHDLKDIFFAEQQLIKSLDKMEKEAKIPEIKEAFAQHKAETKGQVERLKEVFRMMGESPKAQKCPGILGIIKEKEEFNKEVSKGKDGKELLDLYNLGAASKVERYEISAYEGLINIAQKHDMTDVIPLLAANLEEERAALTKVQDLALNFDTADIKSGMAY